MKKVIVNVTFEYEIEIDETNHIVKEYGSDEELIVQVEISEAIYL